MTEEIKNKSIFDRIQKLVLDGEELLEGSTQKRSYHAWAIRTTNEILKIYGASSHIYNEYKSFSRIIRNKEHFTIALFEEKFNKLKSIYTLLMELNTSEKLLNKSFPSKIPNTKNIFIIHGHDELNSLKLKNILSDDFHLSPIMIASKPGQSRSIIDKFEIDASTCSFAFALFTKDDEVKNSNDIYHQARPNVIFESGWFTGRLSKHRVVLLLQNGTKIHSDLDGISRIQFHKDIKEKYKEIKDELEAANMI